MKEQAMTPITHADRMAARDGVDPENLAKLREAARDCPELNACLWMHENGRWTFEHALTQAVLSLAKQNKDLMAAVLKTKMLEPGQPLFMSR